MGDRGPHIRILMGTYQGADYLQAQLDSFTAQTHDNWSLWVSDDGSTDATPGILKRFAEAHPDREIRLCTGSKKGICANFLSLLTHHDLPGDSLIALSDQDDVWAPDRLAAVAAHLGPGRRGAPMLYGSDTIVTDAALRPLGRTRRYKWQPGFPNALLQNMVAGNTMALSAAGLALVRRAQPATPVPCHDWWLYLLITGAGGRVAYDPVPRVFYRQHGANTLGAHRGLRAALRRVACLRDGTYRDWIASNLAALDSVRVHLTAPHRACVKRLCATQGTGGVARLSSLHRAGARRHDRAGQLAVSVMALTGHV